MSMRFAMIFFGACVLIFLGGLGFIFFHFGPGKQMVEAMQPKPLPTRDEFKNNVFGQRPSTILRVVGEPDRRTTFGAGNEYWYYYGKTMDPVTGRRDRTATIRVEGGVVADQVDFD